MPPDLDLDQRRVVDSRHIRRPMDVFLSLYTRAPDRATKMSRKNRPLRRTLCFGAFDGP
jgi:hypothetical protein